MLRAARLRCEFACLHAIAPPKTHHQPVLRHFDDESDVQAILSLDISRRESGRIITVIDWPLLTAIVSRKDLVPQRFVLNFIENDSPHQTSPIFDTYLIMLLNIQYTEVSTND